jgi:hypothetical protein
VNSANKNYSSKDGVLFNKAETELVAYPAGKKVSRYTVPATITSIGSRAFYGCRSLVSINLPATLTYIGSSAFSGCSSLVSINLPSSLTSIGNHTFEGCSSLISISLPANVINIGYYAFSECASLVAIEVNSANKNYSSRDGVLFNKAETELITYPAEKKLSTYTVPTTVTSIGESAFYGCSSLVSISLPASVTSIGSGAFLECTNLSSVNVLAQMPPKLDGMSIVFPPGARIYVPAASLSAYVDSHWYTYSDQLVGQP